MATRHAESDAPSRPSGRTRAGRNAWLGGVAGAIGLGCCVYPVVLVSLGLSSASAAVDLGNHLYAEWGWAFKLAGVAFASFALLMQRRRARACAVDARPRLARNATVLAVVAIATYATLYAATTWLGQLSA